MDFTQMQLNATNINKMFPKDKFLEFASTTMPLEQASRIYDLAFPSTVNTGSHKPKMMSRASAADLIFPAADPSTGAPIAPWEHRRKKRGQNYANDYNPVIGTAATNEFIDEDIDDFMVTDGDSLDTLIKGRKETIRLLHVDTPEYDQVYGSEAHEYLNKLTQGRRLKIRHWGQRDPYGRLLGILSLDDGTSVNQSMVENGFAWRSNYSNESDFGEWEKQAKAKRKGLWGALPIGPGYEGNYKSNPWLPLFTLGRQDEYVPFTEADKKKWENPSFIDNALEFGANVLGIRNRPGLPMFDWSAATKLLGAGIDTQAQNLDWATDKIYGKTDSPMPNPIKTFDESLSSMYNYSPQSMPGLFGMPATASEGVDSARIYENTQKYLDAASSIITKHPVGEKILENPLAFEIVNDLKALISTKVGMGVEDVLDPRAHLFGLGLGKALPPMARAVAKPILKSRLAQNILQNLDPKNFLEYLSKSRQASQEATLAFTNPEEYLNLSADLKHAKILDDTIQQFAGLSDPSSLSIGQRLDQGFARFLNSVAAQGTENPLYYSPLKFSGDLAEDIKMRKLFETSEVPELPEEVKSAPVIKKVDKTTSTPIDSDEEDFDILNFEFDKMDTLDLSTFKDKEVDIDVDSTEIKEAVGQVDSNTMPTKKENLELITKAAKKNNLPLGRSIRDLSALVKQRGIPQSKKQVNETIIDAISSTKAQKDKLKEGLVALTADAKRDTKLEHDIFSFWDKKADNNIAEYLQKLFEKNPKIYYSYMQELLHTGSTRNFSKNMSKLFIKQSIDENMLSYYDDVIKNLGIPSNIKDEAAANTLLQSIQAARKNVLLNKSNETPEEAAARIKAEAIRLGILKDDIETIIPDHVEVDEVVEASELGKKLGKALGMQQFDLMQAEMGKYGSELIKDQKYRQSVPRGLTMQDKKRMFPNQALKKYNAVVIPSNVFLDADYLKEGKIVASFKDPEKGLRSHEIIHAPTDSKISTQDLKIKASAWKAAMIKDLNIHTSQKGDFPFQTDINGTPVITINRYPYFRIKNVKDVPIEGWAGAPDAKILEQQFKYLKYMADQHPEWKNIAIQVPWTKDIAPEARAAANSYLDDRFEFIYQEFNYDKPGKENLFGQSKIKSHEEGLDDDIDESDEIDDVDDVDDIEVQSLEGELDNILADDSKISAPKTIDESVAKANQMKFPPSTASVKERLTFARNYLFTRYFNEDTLKVWSDRDPNVTLDKLKEYLIFGIKQILPEQIMNLPADKVKKHITEQSMNLKAMRNILIDSAAKDFERLVNLVAEQPKSKQMRLAASAEDSIKKANDIKPPAADAPIEEVTRYARNYLYTYLYNEPNLKRNNTNIDVFETSLREIVQKAVPIAKASEGDVSLMFNRALKHWAAFKSILNDDEAMKKLINLFIEDPSKPEVPPSTPSTPSSEKDDIEVRDLDEMDAIDIDSDDIEVRDLDSMDAIDTDSDDIEVRDLDSMDVISTDTSAPPSNTPVSPSSTRTVQHGTYATKPQSKPVSKLALGVLKKAINEVKSSNDVMAKALGNVSYINLYKNAKDGSIVVDLKCSAPKKELKKYLDLHKDEIEKVFSKVMDKKAIVQIAFMGPEKSALPKQTKQQIMDKNDKSIINYITKKDKQIWGILQNTNEQDPRVKSTTNNWLIDGKLDSLTKGKTGPDNVLFRMLYAMHRTPLSNGKKRILKHVWNTHLHHIKNAIADRLRANQITPPTEAIHNYFKALDKLPKVKSQTESEFLTEVKSALNQALAENHLSIGLKSEESDMLFDLTFNSKSVDDLYPAADIKGVISTVSPNIKYLYGDITNAQSKAVVIPVTAKGTIRDKFPPVMHQVSKDSQYTSAIEAYQTIAKSPYEGAKLGEIKPISMPNNRWMLAMPTRIKATGFSEYHSLPGSLKKIRAWAEHNNIGSIAIPHLIKDGDPPEYAFRFNRIIEDVFKDSKVKVNIFATGDTMKPFYTKSGGSIQIRAIMDSIDAKLSELHTAKIKPELDALQEKYSEGYIRAEQYRDAINKAKHRPKLRYSLNSPPETDALKGDTLSSLVARMLRDPQSITEAEFVSYFKNQVGSEWSDELAKFVSSKYDQFKEKSATDITSIDSDNFSNKLVERIKKEKAENTSSSTKPNLAYIGVHKSDVDEHVVMHEGDLINEKNKIKPRTTSMSFDSLEFHFGTDSADDLKTLVKVIANLDEAKMRSTENIAKELNLTKAEYESLSRLKKLGYFKDTYLNRNAYNKSKIEDMYGTDAQNAHFGYTPTNKALKAAITIQVIGNGDPQKAIDNLQDEMVKMVLGDHFDMNATIAKIKTKLASSSKLMKLLKKANPGKSLDSLIKEELLYIVAKEYNPVIAADEDYMVRLADKSADIDTTESGDIFELDEKDVDSFDLTYDDALIDEDVKGNDYKVSVIKEKLNTDVYHEWTTSDIEKVAADDAIDTSSLSYGALGRMIATHAFIDADSHIMKKLPADLTASVKFFSDPESKRLIKNAYMDALAEAEDRWLSIPQVKITSKKTSYVGRILSEDAKYYYVRSGLVTHKVPKKGAIKEPYTAFSRPDTLTNAAMQHSGIYEISMSPEDIAKRSTPITYKPYGQGYQLVNIDVSFRDGFMVFNNLEQASAFLNHMKDIRTKLYKSGVPLESEMRYASGGTHNPDYKLSPHEPSIQFVNVDDLQKLRLETWKEFGDGSKRPLKTKTFLQSNPDLNIRNRDTFLNRYVGEYEDVADRYTIDLSSPAKYKIDNSMFHASIGRSEITRLETMFPIASKIMDYRSKGKMYAEYLSNAQVLNIMLKKDAYDKVLSLRRTHTDAQILDFIADKLKTADSKTPLRKLPERNYSSKLRKEKEQKLRSKYSVLNPLTYEQKSAELDAYFNGSYTEADIYKLMEEFISNPDSFLNGKWTIWNSTVIDDSYKTLDNDKLAEAFESGFTSDQLAEMTSKLNMEFKKVQTDPDTGYDTAIDDRINPQKYRGVILRQDKLAEYPDGLIQANPATVVKTYGSKWYQNKQLKFNSGDVKRAPASIRAQIYTHFNEYKGKFYHMSIAEDVTSQIHTIREPRSTERNAGVAITDASFYHAFNEILKIRDSNPDHEAFKNFTAVGIKVREPFNTPKTVILDPNNPIGNPTLHANILNKAGVELCNSFGIKVNSSTWSEKQYRWDGQKMVKKDIMSTGHGLLPDDIELAKAHALFDRLQKIDLEEASPEYTDLSWMGARMHSLRESNPNLIDKEVEVHTIEGPTMINIGHRVLLEDNDWWWIHDIGDKNIAVRNNQGVIKYLPRSTSMIINASDKPLTMTVHAGIPMDTAIKNITDDPKVKAFFRRLFGFGEDKKLAIMTQKVISEKDTIQGHLHNAYLMSSPYWKNHFKLTELEASKFADTLGIAIQPNFIDNPEKMLAALNSNVGKKFTLDQAREALNIVKQCKYEMGALADQLAIYAGDDDFYVKQLREFAPNDTWEGLIKAAYQQNADKLEGIRTNLYNRLLDLMKTKNGDADTIQMYKSNLSLIDSLLDDTKETKLIASFVEFAPKWASDTKHVSDVYKPNYVRIVNPVLGPLNGKYVERGFWNKTIFPLVSTIQNIAEVKHKAFNELKVIGYNPLKYKTKIVPLLKTPVAPEVQKALGLITEPAYEYGRLMVESQGKLAVLKGYKIFEQSGYIKDNVTPNDINQGWKQLFNLHPSIDNKFAHPQLFDELMELDNVVQGWAKTYLEVTQLWKAAQIPLSSTAWANNIMSNVIAMDQIYGVGISGIATGRLFGVEGANVDPNIINPYIRASKAFSSKTGLDAEAYKISADSGAYLGGIMHEELNELVDASSRNNIIKIVRNISEAYNGVDNYFKFMAFWEEVARHPQGGTYEIVIDKLSKWRTSDITQYQKWIQEVGTPCAEGARDAIVSYDKLNRFVKHLRKVPVVGNPVVSYLASYLTRRLPKGLGLTWANLPEHTYSPGTNQWSKRLRYLMYLLLPWGATQMIQQMQGITSEQEVAGSPSYQHDPLIDKLTKSKVTGKVARYVGMSESQLYALATQAKNGMIFLGLDKNGNRQYWSMKNVMPEYNLDRQLWPFERESIWFKDPIAGLVRDLMTNKNAYTNTPIWNDYASKEEKLRLGIKHTAKSLLPPLLGGRHYDRIKRASNEELNIMGRPKETINNALIGTLLGLPITTSDTGAVLKWKYMEAQKDVRKMQEYLKIKHRQMQSRMITVDDYNRERKLILQDMEEAYHLISLVNPDTAKRLSNEIEGIKTPPKKGPRQSLPKMEFNGVMINFK